jgi:hypothetical protein
MNVTPEVEANRTKFLDALRFTDEKRRIARVLRKGNQVCAVGLAYETLGIRIHHYGPTISADLFDALGSLNIDITAWNDCPGIDVDLPFRYTWAEVADMQALRWKEADAAPPRPPLKCLEVNGGQ